jgi:hypothetical protein
METVLESLVDSLANFHVLGDRSFWSLWLTVYRPFMFWVIEIVVESLIDSVPTLQNWDDRNFFWSLWSTVYQPSMSWVIEIFFNLW